MRWDIQGIIIIVMEKVFSSDLHDRSYFHRVFQFTFFYFFQCQKFFCLFLFPPHFVTKYLFSFMKQIFFMCFINVYSWNHEMDKPIQIYVFFYCMFSPFICYSFSQCRSLECFYWNTGRMIDIFLFVPCILQFLYAMVC